MSQPGQPAQAPGGVPADVVESLLQLSSAEQRARALRAAGLWHAAGLGQLLDYAGSQMRGDPGRAGRVAELCMEAAHPAGAPATWPAAAYLRAQTFAIRGDFEIALELIEAARAAYAAQGDELAALRTNIGQMHVLNELGRHPQALAAGQAVLDALDTGRELQPAEWMLLALAHGNRGICLETTGQYEAALAAYAHAEGHFKTLGLADRVAEVVNNRGIVLMHLGRVSEALAALEAAVPLWAEAGLTLRQAQALSNMGEAHLLLGHYAQALGAYEHARRLLEPLDAGTSQGILQRKTADAYLALNLYPEALAAYREAIALLQEAQMADHRARALWGQGAALAAEGRRLEAQEALAQAAALFAAAGNVPMQCSVWLEQAALQQAQGQLAAALATARAALGVVKGQAWPVQRLYALLRLADLLLPDATSAEPYLASAERLAEQTRLSLPVASFRLHSRLGHLRRLQGRVEAAEVHLEQATRTVETLRGNLAQEALRTSFLRDKVAAFEDLIQLRLEHGGPERARQAFALAERAKSRALVDLLTGLRPARPVPADEDLAGQIEALQAELNATYNRWLEVPTPDSPEAAAGAEAQAEGQTEDLERRAQELEQAISQLRLRAPAAPAGGLAAHPLGSALPLEAIEQQLPAGLLVVAYHVVGDEILAFVRAGQGLSVVRGLARVGQVQAWLQRLGAQWDRFRAGGAFAARHMRPLLASTQRVLAALYAALVAPLESTLAAQPSPHLAIVPHGLLHSVPFHALFDGQRYLLDRFAISYAPSATVLALCQARGFASEARGFASQARGSDGVAERHQAVVAGVPDALIPAAEAEVGAVARQLAEAGVPGTTLVGDQATLAALRAAAPRASVLHLACHGLFRADNPMFSALKLHDGWLTAADVLELNLPPGLVVLSACESGRGTVVPGDEVVGLPRAFLGAGAAAVLVSLWLVPDATTAELMADCYGQLAAGVGRAEALRQAQMALRERQPHPYYWAPFALIGQR